LAAAACWKLSTQIGASADTTAFLALCSAIFVAVFRSEVTDPLLGDRS
jgi:hypothetical protein